MLTDPIGDMFTRIRNALAQRHAEVRIPYSKLKYSICEILFKNGFVESFKIDKDENSKQIILIKLKYKKDTSPILKNLRRISKPSKRVYIAKDEIQKPKGFGVLFLSTSKGVVCGKTARNLNVGGEVLGEVW